MNFEEAVMPHMDAAYNLARWLTRNDADAQDMVQEAYLRALRFFSGFRGTDARAWLLTIVRNTCYTWLRRNRSPELSCDFDEVVFAREAEGPDPETEQLQKAQDFIEIQNVERANQRHGSSQSEMSKQRSRVPAVHCDPPGWDLIVS